MRLDAPLSNEVVSSSSGVGIPDVNAQISVFQGQGFGQGFFWGRGGREGALLE